MRCTQSSRTPLSYPAVYGVVVQLKRLLPALSLSLSLALGSVSKAALLMGLMPHSNNLRTNVASFPAAHKAPVPGRSSLRMSPRSSSR